MSHRESIIVKFKRTVLVVDDELINVEIIREILSDAYEIIAASNGEEALSALRASPTPVSLILLDINMPVMNGFEFLEKVKEEEEYRRIPVIVLTAEKESELTSLQKGAVDFIKKPFDMPDIIVARVRRSIELAEDRLVIQATERDEVTGVYNEHIFKEYVAKMDAFKPDAKMDLIVLNYERFHLYNEMYGRIAGDRAMQCFADILKRIARDREGIVGRSGKGDFLLYAQRNEEYEALFKSIEQDLHEHYELSGLRFRMGVYHCDDKEESFELRMENAKLVCDEIRGSGLTSFAVYDAEERKQAVFRERLVNDAHGAIETHGFVVYFQPKFNITGDQPFLSSAEALVRWIHPEYGFISPGQFIPLFESNGMIRELDYFVWKEAARHIAEWKRKYGIVIPVSVNVSRVDLYNDHVGLDLLKICADAGISPSDLYLEITESAYADEAHQLVGMVDHLRELGFRIEIDDFGSGYSSLNSLTTVTFDVLKLDMQFVKTLEINEKTRKMVAIVADIARFLGVPVVAEGVETAKQLAYLKEKGYQVIQGYYFSKPLPAAEFEEKFLKGGK